MSKDRFSQRYGYSKPEAKIVVRQDAPPELRSLVADLAYKEGAKPSSLRSIICGVTWKRADDSNWSEWPNIAQEVQNLLDECEWYKVYDIIEAVYDRLLRAEQEDAAEHYASSLNTYFRERGVGWQLVEGKLVMRGEEAFESSVHGAIAALQTHDKNTAAGELHEALTDLSRRPAPDVTGAVQHSMAALECIARDFEGDPKSTLGSLLKKHPDLVPPPLNECIDKAWGFASEQGRHLREGRTPSQADAELVVGIVSAVASYLTRKIEEESQRGQTDGLH
jgi:hypothetical protein